MKVGFLMAVCILFLSSCVKSDNSCTPRSPENEETQMKTYASTNGINTFKHQTGIHYQVISPGWGSAPTSSSKVFIAYTGKLLNGQIFDQQTDATKTGWVLSSLIEGWRIGLPMISKGGKIKLIVPSAYGYGCEDVKNQQGQVVIPANSVLYFEVELVDVQ